MVVEDHVAVAVNAFGHHLVVVPHGGVVVQAHGQMISDQVLARDPQVKWVPVLELVPHFVQVLLRHLEVGRVSAFFEDVVPALVAHVFGLNSEGSRLAAVEGTALEQVGDRVVSHVDRGIGEGLDQECVVPWEHSAQTLRPSAPPLLEPVENQVEFMLGLGVVGVEAGTAEVSSDLLLPLVLSVLEEPLVATGNDAVITGSRHNFALWFIVWNAQVLSLKLFLDQGLGFLNGDTFGNTYEHLALVESLEVGLVFGLLQ